MQEMGQVALQILRLIDQGGPQAPAQRIAPVSDVVDLPGTGAEASAQRSQLPAPPPQTSSLPNAFQGAAQAYNAGGGSSAAAATGEGRATSGGFDFQSAIPLIGQGLSLLGQGQQQEQPRLTLNAPRVDTPRADDNLLANPQLQSLIIQNLLGVAAQNQGVPGSLTLGNLIGG